MSIWFMARAVVKADMPQARTFGWLILFGLLIAFVHGMVDNYLYNGNGTLLSLALAALSMPRETEPANIIPHNNYRIPSFVALALISFFMMNLNRVRSVWYADLGAVQMAKVELAGFPTSQWTESSILPRLAQAESSFRSALQADPTNQTANHRLGLIEMLQGDFLSATAYLEEANQKAPNHRGIIKSLGYCYVWSGEMERAQLFLNRIPEARHELDVYVWWWEAQGRTDLSENAIMMAFILESSSSQ
jgi:tetratricopeptide (TPR) repeat protein